MGISDIFDIEKSDLSGLLENNERLKISEAIHKAFIEVDEDGTEVKFFYLFIFESIFPNFYIIFIRFFSSQTRLK